MKFISSRDNPTVKHLRQLADDPREQRRLGQTLIDGPHLLRAHRERVGMPRMLLISESGAHHDEITALLGQHEGVECLCVRDSVFRELSGVASPVGILALIDIPSVGDIEPMGHWLLLDAVQDAGNLGSLLRSAAAAGFLNVFLGPGCAGAWTPRVMRAGQGAHFSLRIQEHADLAALIRRYNGTVLTTDVSAGQSLFGVDLQRPVAWLFGSEGRGVDPSLAALADIRVTIPMNSEVESLNVAAAAAVCLFETVRQNHSGVPHV